MAVVLTLLSGGELSGDADRVAAAAGARIVRATAATRKNWLAADSVLLDEGAARRCAQDRLPRRDGVLLLAAVEPSTSTWSAAIEVGAQGVYTLPAQETEVVRLLSDAAESRSITAGGGRIIAVLPGRGGGGASVFATAVAQCAGDALLVDLDPGAGGVDLLLGVESQPGLRWPDLTAQTGRLNWSAVREALPQRDGVTVLSAARSYHDVDAGLFASLAEAGRRGGTTVVCDVPRQLGSAAACAVEVADLVVIVTCCDVRGIAAATAVNGLVRTINRNVGLVVRGPAPGGMSARQAAEVVAAPLLASLRPEPMLARSLERGGLRLRRRSALTLAARTVLASVHGAPVRTA